jgi:hypothetical protein
MKMKKLLAFLLATMAVAVTHAQNTPWSNSDFIGIGTTSPMTPLDIKLGANQHVQFVANVNGDYPGSAGIASINDTNTGYTPLGFLASNYYFGSGYVGINTQTPGAVLDVGRLLTVGQLGSVLGRLVEGNTDGSGTYLGVKGYDTQPSSATPILNNVKSFAIEHSFYGITNSSINFLRGYSKYGGSISFNTDDNSEKMRITGSGNVGIGTITPDAKLAVNGTIHTKEVKVDLTGWPDYVFKRGYKLSSLITVKSYIDQNHHLPEMPSEQQIVKEGLNLGEMNRLLVKKVEELTLYLIEKDRQINKLEIIQAKYQDEQTQIDQLKQQMETLIKTVRKN